MYDTLHPRSFPNIISAFLSPGATFARRKKTKRDRHAQLKKKISLARDGHALVTENPHGLYKRW